MTQWFSVVHSEKKHSWHTQKLNYMVAQKFAHFWLLILNSMSTFGSISTFKVGLDS